MVVLLFYRLAVAPFHLETRVRKAETKPKTIPTPILGFLKKEN